MQEPVVTRSRWLARSGWLARHAIPAALSTVFIIPLALMVVGSLRPGGVATPDGLVLTPSGISTESFTRLTELLPLGLFIRNSVIVTALAVPLTLLTASLAGFGIRLLPRRAAVTAVLISLVILLVPASALWITRFQVYGALGLNGSLLPLVAPALMGTTPLFVLVYAWAFGRVTDSQLQAARLEGESTLAIWWSLALPQVGQATLAVGVLAFAFHWGNFIDALLYLQGLENYTVPLGLDSLKLLRPTEFPLLLAGAVVFTIPSLVVFGLGSRLFGDDPLAALGVGRPRTSKE